MSSVGSFFSYVNDARSHEPEVCILVFNSDLYMFSSFWNMFCVWRIFNGMQEMIRTVSDNFDIPRSRRFVRAVFDHRRQSGVSNR